MEGFHVEKGAGADERYASPAALELISRFGQMEEDKGGERQCGSVRLIRHQSMIHMQLMIQAEQTKVVT